MLVLDCVECGFGYLIKLEFVNLGFGWLGFASRFCGFFWVLDLMLVVVSCVVGVLWL